MKLIDTTLVQRIDTLQRNTYFPDMPVPVLKEVALHMQLREYQRGDNLFWEVDPCDGLYILETGSAKIYRLSPQGRQYILRILQEGDTFAEVPAFDGGLNPVNLGGAPIYFTLSGFSYATATPALRLFVS